MEHKIGPSQYQNHETVLEAQVQHEDEDISCADAREQDR